MKHFIGRTTDSEPRFYRLIYNVASLVMLAWVMSTYRSSRVVYFAPGIWSLVLYAIQLAVAGIIFQCVRQTGIGDFLGTSQIRSVSSQPHVLITSGCYAHMRHPLYFYSTLFLILNPVMTAQWIILTLMSVAYFIIGGLIEERRLLETYGEEYRHYQQRVPFMLPF
jgi:protein-S-isoprenylcysteine O-methyltransferase Ste14